MGEIVALMAFLLGAVFIWLAEKAWRWFVGLFPPTALGALTCLRNVAAYLLILVIFGFTAYIFGAGTYGRMDGDRDWWSVQALDIMTLPEVAASIASFIIGMLLVRTRVALRAGYREFISIWRLQVRRRAAADEEGGGGFPWLAGAVGLGAVALVAFVAVFIFYPDLGNRLSSIKVADVEAEFATSTAHSARVVLQPERIRTNNRYVMGRWAGIDYILKTFTAPALTKVLINDAAAAKQSNEEQERIRNFLDALAVPLSEVMVCFSQDFDPRYTFVQPKAAPLAKRWRRFAVELATAKQPTDTFDALHADLQSLIVSVDADLRERHSRCGKPRDEAYFASRDYTPLTADTKQHRPDIFRDGYTIAFISDMLISTAGADEAVRYMNDVGKPLENVDKHSGAVAGKYNYYSILAQARWQSEDWRFDDWIEDVREARSIADTIAYAVRKTNGGPDADSLGVEAHYRMLAANNVNSVIYGYVRDWLEGRHRTPLQLAEPKSLAKQLSDWLDAQPEAELLNARDDPGNHGEALAHLILMANGYDTLGMYELLANQTGMEMSKEHCERSLGSLDASKAIFGKLSLASAVDAHMNIYETVCGPLTAQ